MHARLDCPPDDDLRRLIEAGGTEGEVDALAQHLEQCEACGSALETILAQDATLADLPAGRFKAPVPVADPALQSLAAKLRRLKPAAAAALASEDTYVPGGNDTSLGVPVADGTSVDFTFLDSPELPDELGRLANYRILQQLGKGGMGIVFLAEDLVLHRRVALKTMLPSLAVNPQTRERFLREARAAAAIEHENVISIHHVGEVHGIPYLTMPFLKGESLGQRLEREGKLPLAEALRISAEMADGLAAAHAQGLIHRDIKPCNTWLEAPRGRVKLLDFGLARAAAESGDLTSTGDILGTPAFMAPEQSRGEAIDHRADLFSLGAVLYLMLTGRRPFEGESVISVLTALALHEPSAPRELDVTIPSAVSQLTMRLLTKDAARRPATARETGDELLRLAAPVSPASGGRAVARPPTMPGRGLWTGSWPLIAVGCLGVAVLAGAFVIRLQTNRGEVVLESKDDRILITAKQTGTEPVVEVVQEPAVPAAAVGVVRLQNAPPAPVAAPEYAEPPEFVAWKAEVAELPPEAQVAAVSRQMQELNPGFDGKIESRVDAGVVTFARLNTDKVADISPLRALPQLVELNLSSGTAWRGRVDSLQPLAGMRLRELNLSGNNVSDLSPLRGIPLRKLNCNATRVRDVTPVLAMPLRELWLPMNRPETDVIAVRALRDVKTLERLNNRPMEVWISELPGLTEAAAVLAELRELNPAYDGMALVRIEKGRVKGLTVGGTDVSHVAPLKKLEQLEALNLGRGQHWKIVGFDELRGLRLRELNVRGALIVDITALSGMPLQKLDLSETRVAELSPLRGCPLETLEYRNARVPETPLLYELLKSMSALKTINGRPVSEVFQKPNAKPIENSP